MPTGPAVEQPRAPGKRFEVDFRTVARWDDDGQIIEANLFYDLLSFMKQIGLSK